MKMQIINWSFLSILLLAAQLGVAAERSETLSLSGTLTREDHQTYREVPFTVPEGVKRLTVTVDYERENKTVVDLGLFDSERFRDWSGGNKASFTVSEADATPSYLPGPLPAGEWKLIVGVPNLRSGTTAEYQVQITLGYGAAAQTQGFADQALSEQAGWYRGELHAHSGHSDGSCASQSGTRVPCPAYRSVEAAAAENLDFLALTEHNATSHYQSLRELQPVFDQMVLMSGREITTFYGHANVFGSSEFIDFRATTPAQTRRVLEDAKRAGAVVSINHPGLPSGEICMGCGWTGEVEGALVDAVEIVNGSVLDNARGVLKNPLSGIPFWESLLNAGHRVTGIAGSDNHNADLEGDKGVVIGRIETVVFARDLSQAGLLEGIRSGRVFIDLQGSGKRSVDLEVTAESGSASEQKALMGDTLRAPQGSSVTLTARIDGVIKPRLLLVRNGEALSVKAEYEGDGDSSIARAELEASGEREWIRAEVLSESGEVLLLSNPVYLNF
ncbi:PHP domain-containing protein [Proteobacteria bacterium 005FR1]|nr:PHP domain-containing protein [Proteobacteria bacterium 005FR1]